MITLIGHGYIGTHIHNELADQDLKHNWITHTDPIPTGTRSEEHTSELQSH